MNYYALISKNGYGVMSSYGQALGKQKYLKTITTKKFDNFYEAMAYAEARYQDMNPDIPLGEQPKLGSYVSTKELLNKRGI